MTNFPSSVSPRVTSYVSPPPSALRGSVLIARLIVGGVLLYAGFSKALPPASDFAAIIEAYHLVPASWATPISLGLPWIEMWVGLAIFLGYWTRAFAAAALLLFGVFITALGSALLRNIDLVSCGCFGADTLSPHVTIWIDGTLVLFSIFILAASVGDGLWSIDAWIEKPTPPRRR